HELGLAQDGAAGELGRTFELDQRRLADRLDDTVTDLHGRDRCCGERPSRTTCGVTSQGKKRVRAGRTHGCSRLLPRFRPATARQGAMPISLLVNLQVKGVFWRIEST